MYDLRERNDFGRFENSRVRKIQIPVHFELRTVAITLVFIGSENNFLGRSGHMEVEAKQIRAGVCGSRLLGLIALVCPHMHSVCCLSLSISDE